MAQYHHVIWFDTADERWHTDPASRDCYMPDGEVWDDSTPGEEPYWRGLGDIEEDHYLAQAFDLVDFLNTQDPFLGK